MKPIPTSSIDRSTCSGVSSIATPSPSSRSAEPHGWSDRLPCFATPHPAPAITNAAVVEILKVSECRRRYRRYRQRRSSGRELDRRACSRIAWRTRRSPRPSRPASARRSTALRSAPGSPRPLMIWSIAPAARFIDGERIRLSTAVPNGLTRYRNRVPFGTSDPSSQ